MATLRKFVSFRSLDRPYTRKSKFKKKNYIKSIPHHKIAKFDVGNKTRGHWQYKVKLISKDTLQIRHNAFESARQLINRHLQEKLGATNYYLKVNLYPHQALRENRMLTGAGADRMQTGMAHSFGKVVGSAARVKRGSALFTAHVDEGGKAIAEQIMKKANSRLPCHISVIIEKDYVAA